MWYIVPYSWIATFLSLYTPLKTVYYGRGKHGNETIFFYAGPDPNYKLPKNARQQVHMLVDKAIGNSQLNKIRGTKKDDFL